MLQQQIEVLHGAAGGCRSSRGSTHWVSLCGTQGGRRCTVPAMNAGAGAGARRGTRGVGRDADAGAVQVSEPHLDVTSRRSGRYAFRMSLKGSNSI